MQKTQSCGNTYFPATPPGVGGIASTWICGTEEALRRLDADVFARGAPVQQFAGQGLRYGFFRNADGETIDEVVWACPCEGWRIVTGHGGRAATDALRKRLEELGWLRNDTSPCVTPLSISATANTCLAECDALLPLCQTETQVACVLAARASLENECRAIQSLVPTDTQAVDARLASLLARGEIAARLLAPRRVSLIGLPNAGKSSLFNCLVGSDRVLVSEEAGTTRDRVCEWIDLGGYAVLLADTAGLRQEGHDAERRAHQQALDSLDDSDLLIFLLDGSAPLSEETRELAATIRRRMDTLPSAPELIVVVTRDDIGQGTTDADVDALFPRRAWCRVSCLSADAVGVVTRLAVPALGGVWDGGVSPVTPRQMSILRAWQEALQTSAPDYSHTSILDALFSAQA